MAKVKKTVTAANSGAQPQKALSARSRSARGGKPVINTKAMAGKSAGAANHTKGKFQPAPPVVEEKQATRSGGGPAHRSLGAGGNKHLNAEKKRELRDKLLRLRERLTGQINFLATDNLSRTPKDNEVDFRSEEQGTDNFDRDSALNRVSLEQNIIFEIDEALSRINSGTFGLCIFCNGPIEKARLEVLPYSRMCVACQSRSETGRRKVRTFETATLFPNADKTIPEAAVEEE